MSGDWQRDGQLLEAWRGGNDRAGEQLYDRHADAVARFFSNKLREGAEDLTQTTFLRLIEKRDGIREGVAFRAFVLAVARNVLREHLRSRLPGREVDAEVDTMAQLDPGPVTIAGRKAEHRLLLEGLRRLSINDQILLELYYWEQLSSPEIAAVMNNTPSTIRTLLGNARKRLAKAMAEIAASEELLASTVGGLDGWAAQLRAYLGGDGPNDVPPG